MHASGPPPHDIAPMLGLMLVCSLLWSMAFLLMKVIGADLSPMALTALRGIMGGTFLGLFLATKRQGILPRGREWVDWPILGLFQGLLPNALTAYALLSITTGLASMIQASAPLLVAVMAHFLFADERLTPRRAAGMVAGFTGMAILIGPAAFSFGTSSFNGIVAMVVTSVSYAIGNLYIRTIPRPDPTRMAFGQQVFAALPSLLIVLTLSGPAAFDGAADHVWTLLALGLFSTAMPILLFMHLISRVGPTLGSMNGYLVPVWTLLLGVTLLSETVSPREILGGLVVLAGIAVVSSARRKRAEQATAAAR